MRKQKTLALVLAAAMVLNLSASGGNSVDAATANSTAKQGLAVENDLQINVSQKEKEFQKQWEQWEKEKKQQKERLEEKGRQLSELIQKKGNSRTQKKASDTEAVKATMSELALEDGSYLEAGKGSEIAIETAEDLRMLSEYVNVGKNTEGVAFTQTKDIDCNGATMAAIGAIVATDETDEEGDLVYKINSFKGSYDGGEHQIQNLTIYCDIADDANLIGYASLFSILQGATVKNVVIDSIDYEIVSKEIEEEEDEYEEALEGSLNYSTIAGYAIESVVENCRNYADITLSTSFGALAGIVAGSDSDSVIRNCTNYGNLTAVRGDSSEEDEEASAYNSGVYGIAYYLSGPIKDCINHGNITNYDDAAGILGEFYCYSQKMEGCENTGTITGGSYASGIAKNTYGEITECVNSGSIQSSYVASGILISHVGTIRNCSNRGEVTSEDYASGIAYSVYGEKALKHCSNAGVITGKRAAGGIVAYIGNATISDCTNTGKVVSDKYAGGIAGSGYQIAIYTCVNKGEINSKQSAGGIFGGQDDSSLLSNAMLCNVENFGTIYSDKYAGGITGNQIAAEILNVWNHGNVEGKEASGGILGCADFSSQFDSYFEYEIEEDPEFYGQLKESYLTEEGQKAAMNTIKNAINIGTVSSDKNAGAIIGKTDIMNALEYCYYQEDSAEKVCGSDDAVTATVLQKNAWNNEAFIQELNQNRESFGNPMALVMVYDSEEVVTWESAFVLEVFANADYYDTGDIELSDVYPYLGLNYVLYETNTKEYIPLLSMGNNFYITNPSAGDYEVFRVMQDGSYLSMEESIHIDEGDSIVNESIYPSVFQAIADISYSKNANGTYTLKGNAPHYALAYVDNYMYSDIVMPTEPVREGYIFGGWYSTPYVYSEELYSHFKEICIQDFNYHLDCYAQEYEWVGNRYFDGSQKEYVSQMMIQDYGYDNVDEFTANFDTYVEACYRINNPVETWYDEDEEEEYTYLKASILYAKWIKKSEVQPSAAPVDSQPKVVYQNPDVGKYTETIGSYTKKAGVIYQVDTQKKTAKVTGVTSKQAKNVTIQATVTVGGVKCKVTSVGKKAFADCTKLKKITVKGKNLKSVHKAALKGVKKKVTIKANKKIKKLFKKALKNR